MKKRTDVDFSKHEHRVEVFKCGKNEIRVDHFQVEDSRMRYIKLINTDDTLTVTGDYGNWVFCRPFVPSSDGGVSDCYWLEKLRTASVQVVSEFCSVETEKEIQELINSGLEDYGYKDTELDVLKEWFKDLLEYVDDEIEYTYYAYRYNKPAILDYEMIPFCKKINTWLLIIFDAFDEMCNRLKEQNG